MKGKNSFLIKISIKLPCSWLCPELSHSYLRVEGTGHQLLPRWPVLFWFEKKITERHLKLRRPVKFSSVNDAHCETKVSHSR